MKILLVEDNSRLGKVMEKLLIADGHNVSWVQNGLAAVRLVMSEDIAPDVILLDHELGPGMNGADTASQLREYCPNVPIWGIGGDGNPGEYCDRQFGKEIAGIIAAFVEL